MTAWGHPEHSSVPIFRHFCKIWNFGIIKEYHKCWWTCMKFREWKRGRRWLKGRGQAQELVNWLPQIKEIPRGHQPSRVIVVGTRSNRLHLGFIRILGPRSGMFFFQFFKTPRRAFLAFPMLVELCNVRVEYLRQVYSYSFLVCLFVCLSICLFVYIWLTTAVWRGFGLYECLLV